MPSTRRSGGGGGGGGWTRRQQNKRGGRTSSTFTAAPKRSRRTHTERVETSETGAAGVSIPPTFRITDTIEYWENGELHVINLIRTSVFDVEEATNFVNSEISRQYNRSRETISGGGGGGETILSTLREPRPFKKKTTRPEKKLDSDEEKCCSVCFDSINKGEKVFVIPCGHVHHRKCVEDWFDKKGRCPDCRGTV